MSVGVFNCPEALEAQNAERAEIAARRRARRAENARETARYQAARVLYAQQEKARFEASQRGGYRPAYPWQSA